MDGVTAKIATRQVEVNVDEGRAWTNIYLIGKVKFECLPSGTLMCTCDDGEDIGICFRGQQIHDVITALQSVSVEPEPEELPASSQFILDQANILMAGGGK